MRLAASVMPTASSMVRARASAAGREIFSWMSSGSIICSETRVYGLSEVIGSWKIIEMRRPRIERSWAAGALSKSTPSNIAVPLSMRPGGWGTRPMSE